MEIASLPGLRRSQAWFVKWIYAAFGRWSGQRTSHFESSDSGVTLQPVDREHRLLQAIMTLMDVGMRGGEGASSLQVLVDESVALLGADAAGVMLVNSDEQSRITAFTGTHAGVLEFLQLEIGEGPCMEVARTGTAIAVTDLKASTLLWPHFAQASLDAGYSSVHCLPLSRQSTVLGSLNLFRRSPGAFEDVDLAAARALTNVATVTLLQERALDAGAETRAQLEAARESRVLVEQAKGWIANRDNVDTDTAFTALRTYARKHRQSLTQVAFGVLSGRLTFKSPQ